jgi:hypothetical protein
MWELTSHMSNNRQISISSVVPDQKLLAVSWLEGDLREELLLVVQYPCGAMAAASIGWSVVVVVVVVVWSRRGHQYVGRVIDVKWTIINVGAISHIDNSPHILMTSTWFEQHANFQIDVITQQQQITLPTLQPLHHKDTGQQGVALVSKSPSSQALPTTSDLVPPTIRKSVYCCLCGK